MAVQEFPKWVKGRIVQTATEEAVWLAQMTPAVAPNETADLLDVDAAIVETDAPKPRGRKPRGRKPKAT